MLSGLNTTALRQSMQNLGDIPLLARFASEYRDALPTRHEKNVAATFEVSWQLRRVSTTLRHSDG
jgi:hypothetical protein